MKMDDPIIRNIGNIGGIKILDIFVIDWSEWKYFFKCVQTMDLIICA